MFHKLSTRLVAAVLSVVLFSGTAATAFAARPLSGTSTGTTTRTEDSRRNRGEERRSDASPFKGEHDAIERIREKSFPKLESSYAVIGHATKDYNCIAWSLGVTTKWVWPGTATDDFDKLDGQYGFRRMTKLDFSVQKGVEKIVLYGKKVDGKMTMTHQARQMKDGTWTSKLGEMGLIRHASPDSLDGPDYGYPVAVYYRKIQS